MQIPKYIYINQINDIFHQLDSLDILSKNKTLLCCYLNLLEYVDFDKMKVERILSEALRNNIKCKIHLMSKYISFDIFEWLTLDNKIPVLININIFENINIDSLSKFINKHGKECYKFFNDDELLEITKINNEEVAHEIFRMIELAYPQSTLRVHERTAIYISENYKIKNIYRSNSKVRYRCYYYYSLLHRMSYKEHQDVYELILNLLMCSLNSIGCECLLFNSIICKILQNFDLQFILDLSSNYHTIIEGIKQIHSESRIKSAKQ